MRWTQSPKDSGRQPVAQRLHAIKLTDTEDLAFEVDALKIDPVLDGRARRDA